MDFYTVLDKVLELLQRHKRVTYRALKRQFGLDDAYLEDLKAEIIEARQLAVDQDGTMGWIGKKGATDAAFFRGGTNVWGVSRSWIAAAC